MHNPDQVILYPLLLTLLPPARDLCQLSVLCAPFQLLSLLCFYLLHYFDMLVDILLLDPFHRLKNYYVLNRCSPFQVMWRWALNF